AYGLGPEAVDVYRRGRPGASPGDVLSAVVTDWFFRIPSLRLAEARAARGERVHVYEFTWPSPLFEGRLGSCHALEVPFVFDTLDAEGTERLTGPEPPVELASAMHRAWVDFVAGGDPGWPAYDLDRRPVMRFGERSGVEDDPGGGERRLWEGVR
ncbi:MAG TPA: carboxylesterase family protein, partial [Chloroflexota bacterium]|nr:carboxylesterase family protein [Chloroflexota bacterium]